MAVLNDSVLSGLSNIGNEMNSKSIKQIKDYLYQLTESIKYMFNNIDDDNLSTEYKLSLNRAIEAAKAVDTISEVLEKERGITNKAQRERYEALIKLNELMVNSLGMYKTEITQEDGSIKYYMHDQPTLEASATIYTLTSNGYAWTTLGWNNGNPTWEYGADKDGNAIYHSLSVYKLIADLLVAGTIQSADGSSYWNLNNGELNLNGVFISADDIIKLAMYKTANTHVSGVESVNHYSSSIVFGDSAFPVEVGHNPWIGEDGSFGRIVFSKSVYADKTKGSVLIDVEGDISLSTGVNRTGNGADPNCKINIDAGEGTVHIGSRDIEGEIHLYSNTNKIVWHREMNMLGDIGLTAYPVGAIYMSLESTSPASLFGGFWTQISGCFLWATGSTPGETGGAQTVALQESQMPNHGHVGVGNVYTNSGSAIHANYTVGASGMNWDGYQAVYNTGGSGAHNNMPPYYGVYMWWRVG